MIRTHTLKGKKYNWYYEQDEKIVDLVFNEVFTDEDYKEGLTHIRQLKSPVVLDLGAFIGFTPHYFNQAKNVTIHAVEPNPFSFKALTLNCQDNDNIYYHRLSIGYRTKERELIIPEGGIAMSFYAKGDKVFKVESYAIDDFFDEFNISHVDLLKIDVEGAEYEIFLSDGFKKVADRIDMIIGEAHDTPMNHIVLPEILKQTGFTLKWKPDLNYISITDYHLGDIKGQIKMKINTLFTASHLRQ